MLKIYQQQNGGLKGVVLSDADPIPPDSVWIDLLSPTNEERRKVNTLVGMEMPTRADMEEIEVSSRLYQEDGGIFLTALILSNMETDSPVADVVSFVLTHDKLMTIRYIDPQPFRTFAARVVRGSANPQRAEMVLMNLLDVIIDRMADVLERAGADIETISRDIFQPQEGKIMQSKDFQEVLRRLGRKQAPRNEASRSRTPSDKRWCCWAGSLRCAGSSPRPSPCMSCRCCRVSDLPRPRPLASPR